MLKIHEIREIIKLVDQSQLKEFEVKTEETRISLKKNSVVQQFKPLTPPAPVAKVIVNEPVNSVPTPVKREVPKPAVPVQQKQEADETLQKIFSPMVGTFYQAPSEDAPPYVQPGDRVEKTTVVCIVEAMKLFNEIEAETKGEIVEILVQNGQLVEQGQPLFLVRSI
ncbi:acetyl-CoA carboxylase biotin carboxyl carrier protein [Ammoniphilus sp. 3BR4]|uniref:acetyl-CoA carboxylase biotin carboxyl carrier protein n=1 Tax=Ammoniphilus sp. 3BR4 TaxID=3158265 RepID=UPI00346513EC